MDVNPTYKAFLGVAWLFLISSVFTLAKTLRDAHEALSPTPAAKAARERGRRRRMNAIHFQGRST